MAITIVPILMIIVGILIYLMATERSKEIGRAMMWGGFIGLAIAYSSHMVHIG
jgi:hypothetical protein